MSRARFLLRRAAVAMARRAPAESSVSAWFAAMRSSWRSIMASSAHSTASDLARIWDFCRRAIMLHAPVIGLVIGLSKVYERALCRSDAYDAVSLLFGDR